MTQSKKYTLFKTVDIDTRDEEVHKIKTICWQIYLIFKYLTSDNTVLEMGFFILECEFSKFLANFSKINDQPSKLEL